MAESTFATAINCIDGRAQAPVAEWVRQRYTVECVDMVTVAGADGVLVRGAPGVADFLRAGVLISVNQHSSRVIAVAGHHGCAGNPVSREEHLADITAAARRVAAWRMPARVVGLWVNDEWRVEVVCELDSQAGSV